MEQKGYSSQIPFDSNCDNSWQQYQYQFQDRDCRVGTVSWVANSPVPSITQDPFIEGSITTSTRSLLVPTINPGALTILPSKDYYLTFSVFMTILCIVCFSMPSLLCTTPAIILSASANGAAALNKHAEAIYKANASFFLNVAAVLCCAVMYVTIIVVADAV